MSRRPGNRSMMNVTRACVIITALFGGAFAFAGETAAPNDAHLYIGWPNDGEVIQGESFRVWFGLRNMGVAPAGTVRPMTGHHHLIIDTPLPDMDDVIPADRNHVHFGKGQTETVLKLPPGTHTLQLVLADHDHMPHSPPVVSKKITITVR